MTMERADADLERDIDAALARLPLPRAPRTLAPRVMQAIAVAARAAAAGARIGWRSWPVVWQALSLVAACSLWLVVALALPLASLWIRNAGTVKTAAAVWDRFFAPIAVPAVAVVAVMCTATALLVAALKHVAWEGQRTSHS